MRVVTFSTGLTLLDDICITMSIRKPCGNPTRNTGCCISKSRGNTRNRETMTSDNEAFKTLPDVADKTYQAHKQFIHYSTKCEER